MDALSEVKLVREKKLLRQYFNEIGANTGKGCFGINDTLKALELGTVEILIAWEGLDIMRYVLRNASGGAWAIRSKQGLKNDRHYRKDRDP